MMSYPILYDQSLIKISEPRYASLPNIMKAKKKPIEKLTAADLGVELKPILETIKVTEPPKRVGGTKVCVQCCSTVHFFSHVCVCFPRWGLLTSWSPS
jgi:hypothetical protein